MKWYQRKWAILKIIGALTIIIIAIIKYLPHEESKANSIGKIKANDSGDIKVQQGGSSNQQAERDIVTRTEVTKVYPTVTPPQRHVTLEDIKDITSKIKKGSTIKITPYAVENEPLIYIDELKVALAKKGYKIANSTGQSMDDEIYRYKIEIWTDSTAMIWVGRAKTTQTK